MKWIRRTVLVYGAYFTAETYVESRDAKALPAFASDVTRRFRAVVRGSRTNNQRA